MLIYKLLAYIQEALSVDYLPCTPIIDCHIFGTGVVAYTAQNEAIRAEKLIICNGSEGQLLFPEIFKESGLVVSKLQMLKTNPMPHIDLEGNILTGLSIRRYESFEECPSFSTIPTPEHYQELKKWGIHILFKKAIDGSIIIGDSHEYAAIEQMEDLGFDLKEHVNQLMLEEAQKIVSFDVRNIATSWAGFYAQHTEGIFEHQIEDKIYIWTGIGGKGMTSSAGFAENNIKAIYQ